MYNWIIDEWANRQNAVFKALMANNNTINNNQYDSTRTIHPSTNWTSWTWITKGNKIRFCLNFTVFCVNFVANILLHPRPLLDPIKCCCLQTVYFETMSIYADHSNVACHAPIHYKTTAIYRIVRTLRIGTVQEREKKSIPITNNKSDKLGIYLMT
jgi:hypothetical protein